MTTAAAVSAAQADAPATVERVFERPHGEQMKRKERSHGGCYDGCCCDCGSYLEDLKGKGRERKKGTCEGEGQVVSAGRRGGEKKNARMEEEDFELKQRRGNWRE